MPIKLAQPDFDVREEEACLRVLRSGMLVQGAEVAAFERELLAAIAAPREARAIAVSNGTSALELALAALNVGAGDEVIVPDLTWPSPGNAVLLRGATAVLVDVSTQTFNLDPAAMAAALTPRTRAIIAVDQFGVPADFAAIRKIAGDVPIIEDAACAIGSTFGTIACGLHGALSTLSFHPRKVVTTGEGGMVLTSDPSLAERVTALRNHGQRTPGDFVTAGPNERMSELQAAIGRVQIAKLASMVERRRALAEMIRGAMPTLRWQRAPDGATINHQTLSFVLPTPMKGTLNEARDAVIAALRADGVEAGILSYALHRLPQFATHAVNATRRFDNAAAIVDGGIALPLHTKMTASDAQRVVERVSMHASWAK